MAKKKTAEKGEPKDVAKCDTLNEVTPNHDELITSVAQSSPESVSIKAMIRLIRGQQVMLDSDLAFLYGVETRRLNEQVKRNMERFPSDFMFQLTKEEFDFLKSQIAISNISPWCQRKRHWHRTICSH
ncbi:ORF6N domain-containing protein [Segatella bryantii]